MSGSINVFSETGILKKVMLHRPGGELENLMPEHLDRLLFDDIPYLKVAQEEHDEFAALLRSRGCEVVYLDDLVAQSINDSEIRRRFIVDFIHETGVKTSWEADYLQEYFSGLSNQELIAAMCAGVRKSAAGEAGQSLGSLINLLDDEYPFLTDPMPNLYFTRDPFASVGNGVTIHRMRTPVRTRESLFAKYIFTYHPVYRGTKVWYDRTEDSSLEGGDILVLSRSVIAIGISQRTSEKAIEKFSGQILDGDSDFKKVLAFNIPKERSFMHLDTVFTMVDKDKFTVHPNILSRITVFVISREAGKIRINQEVGSLEEILRRHLELDKVTLIPCGRKSPIDAAREQWNDGSNTLCIAPGEVVVYERNTITNRQLEENGVVIHQIRGSELSRGRGGPRCMSMPLVRDDV